MSRLFAHQHRAAVTASDSRAGFRYGSAARHRLILTFANLRGVTPLTPPRQKRILRNCFGFIVRRRLRDLAELWEVTST